MSSHSPVDFREQREGRSRRKGSGTRSVLFPVDACVEGPSKKTDHLGENIGRRRRPNFQGIPVVGLRKSQVVLKV